MLQYVVFTTAAFAILLLAGVAIIGPIFGGPAIANEKGYIPESDLRKFKKCMLGASLTTFILLPLLMIMMLKYQQYYSSWYLLLPLLSNLYFAKCLFKKS